MEHVRLTVSLRPGHGVLARLAATLNNHLVLDLAYTTSSPDSATAVVLVPRSDAPRAQHKLRRLVDVIDVIDMPPDPTTAGAAAVSGFSAPHHPVTDAARPSTVRPMP